MAWNWQTSAWPGFSWDVARFDQAEARFLHGAGVLVGTTRHLNRSDQEVLAVETMSDEAMTTSAIEGELLNRPSVQSSIRRELGLITDRRGARLSERGIAELMVDLYRDFASELDDDMLFRWHRMVTRGRSDLRDVGRYRTHADPMQVVSGRLDHPTVHFEAPPSKQVPKEMRRFIAWFNETAPRGRDPLPAVTRAGVAHVYFESIHPFEDGNGRIGGALSEKALAQALDRPTLTALATTVLAKQREYYEALEAANKTCAITDWLAWFAATTLEAQELTLAHVELLIEKTKLLDRLAQSLNDRQMKALTRMFGAGPRGFEGGMSASKYVSLTKTSPATATRDLASLVELGALRREGERKHARYHLALEARHVPRLEIRTNGAIAEISRSKR